LDYSSVEIDKIIKI
jgi:hypothetical protein